MNESDKSIPLTLAAEPYFILFIS